MENKNFDQIHYLHFDKYLLDVNEIACIMKPNKDSFDSNYYQMIIILKSGQQIETYPFAILDENRKVDKVATKALAMKRYETLKNEWIEAKGHTYHNIKVFNF